MLDLIERHRAQLEDVCRHYGVRRLELFGSAASGRFKPDESDLDFLVEFEPESPLGYADRYFGLLEALQEILGCPVDLVVSSAIRNPYFRDAVDRTRRLLYAA